MIHVAISCHKNADACLSYVHLPCYDKKLLCFLTFIQQIEQEQVHTCIPGQSLIITTQAHSDSSFSTYPNLYTYTGYSKGRGPNISSAMYLVALELHFGLKVFIKGPAVLMVLHRIQNPPSHTPPGILGNEVDWRNHNNILVAPRTVLGIGLLQQCAPELTALCGVDKHELPVLDRKPVVDDHIHPLAELPELQHRKQNLTKLAQGVKRV